jgi:hypothetical protein
MSLIRYQALMSNNKTLAIAILIIVAIAIVDTIISNASGNIGTNFSSTESLFLFITLSILFGAGQFLLINIISFKFNAIKNKVTYLRLLYPLILVTQITLSILLIAAIMQILFTSQYSVYIPAISTLISHSIPFILFSILSIKFLSWYRIIRNYLLLIFATSFITLAISEEIAAIIVFFAVLLKTNPVTADKEVLFPTFEDQPILLHMADVYWIFAYLSFILLWFSIAMLIRQNSERLRKSTYWAIVGIPLAFFVTVIIGVPGITPVYEWFDPYLATIFFAINSTGGAILFAIAFIVLSKKVKQHKLLRSYLIIAASGLLLFFISDQAVVLHTPYPPFGLVTISILGIASYYVLIGIYASAMSISVDSELRKQIRKSAKDKSEFLEHIGIAEVQKNLEDNVIRNCIKKSEQIEKESGIEPSLSESELRDYLGYVIREIHQKDKS